MTSKNYRSGGIIKSIELGSVDSILRETKKDLVLDALVVSICLVLSLYFLVLFFQRDKEPYLAYFSGANFFMALSLSTMDEQIISLIYDYDLVTRSRIQTLAMLMVTICFLRFIHHFFKKYSIKKIANRITGILAILLLFVFYNVNKPGFISIGIMQTIVLAAIAISYTYMAFILMIAIYKKVDSLEYIMVITTTMFAYWLTLSLKTFLKMDLGHIPDILILILMVSVAALMSHRLQLDYEEVINLSEKLMRHDRLKDEFLVKSSHEFKSPLEIILQGTKQLLEGKKGVLNIQQQEALLITYQEMERLRGLTDNLLDTSLIKKDNIKIRLRLRPIQPYKTVEDILKEIEILVPQNESLILRNQIPQDFPRLIVDPDKFKQIIYDLIHNAIKYTKSGEIVISAKKIKDQGEITVKDTGIGIEEKYLKEIFDIFYQKTGKGELDQGLGLGLSIVKHLVEIQGGTIDVKSIYGEGSTFIFTLPLYDENEKVDKVIYEEDDNFIIDVFGEIASTLEEDRQRKLNKARILIINPESLDEKILYNIIKESDYNIIIARTGREALEILGKNKIDLVILDFLLLDMTSSQLCEKIRMEYSMGELPILILTASRRTIDLISSFNYGVNDFQQKPIDPEELKSRIQSLLLIKASGEEGIEKQFQYFYSQISPHFLYNTLNSIIGISYKDSDKTRRALNNLSIFLRGKLDIHRNKGFVTLESELELVTAYLQIEEMRYGDRLGIEYSIEELDARIPPLTLQPIVENAIGHGISTKENGGKIVISTKREPRGFISIIIEDNGKGMTLEDQEKLLEGHSKGIGFKNIMERIKMIKGANLKLESKLGEGTRITITIPEVGGYEGNFS